MKILVTGGAGYVGYTLVRRLIDAALPDPRSLSTTNSSRRNHAFFYFRREVPRRYGPLHPGRNP